MSSLKSRFNRLDLLLKEINDPYVQENFRRLKLFLDAQELSASGGSGGSGGSSTTIINTGTSIWEEYNKALPPSVTTIVDTFTLASFKQCEYIVNFKDSASNKEKGLKLSVIKDDGSLKESIYAIAGSAISLAISTNINGLNYELKVTNNEASSVDMYFARLKIT